MITYILACKDPFFISDMETHLSQQENLFHCEKCNIDCPIRASHCKECGKCVLRRDHHCPFLGKCVGMGNHMYFLLFLLFLSIFDVKTCIVFAKSMIDDLEFGRWLITSLPCTICLFMAVISIIQPVLLFPVHLYFAFANITTWESARKTQITYLSSWNLRLSPFSRGLISNIWEFITMRWKKPSYSVPVSEEELKQWREDNSFLSNDRYECC